VFVTSAGIGVVEVAEFEGRKFVKTNAFNDLLKREPARY
jgi:hypothetical protein